VDVFTKAFFIQEPAKEYFLTRLYPFIFEDTNPKIPIHIHIGERARTFLDLLKNLPKITKI
jgi:hypothetical protein